jgi:hypothetical protein
LKAIRPSRQLNPLGHFEARHGSAFTRSAGDISVTLRGRMSDPFLVGKLMGFHPSYGRHPRRNRPLQVEVPTHGPMKHMAKLPRAAKKASAARYPVRNSNAERGDRSFPGGNKAPPRLKSQLQSSILALLIKTNKNTREVQACQPSN